MRRIKPHMFKELIDLVDEIPNGEIPDQGDCCDLVNVLLLIPNYERRK